MNWLDYLHSRGVTDEQIERHNLYYCDKSVHHPELEGRIIFSLINPIGERKGRLGRSVGDREPKFVISAGASRDEVLWPLHREWKREAAAGPYCFLVESVFDVLALERAGFEASLAFMGSSMGRAQCLDVIRYVRNPIILYHTDRSGEGGALRSQRVLGNMGLSHFRIEPSVLPVATHVGCSDIDELFRIKPYLAIGYLEGLINQCI